MTYDKTDIDTLTKDARRKLVLASAAAADKAMSLMDSAPRAAAALLASAGEAYFNATIDHPAPPRAASIGPTDPPEGS